MLKRDQASERFAASREADLEVSFEHFHGLTQLPRIVQIGETIYPVDAHLETIVTGWCAVFVGYSAGLMGYADFKLPAQWGVQRQVAGPAQLRDARDRVRAWIVERGYRTEPKLVLLPRIYLTLEADDEDGIRVAIVDRASGNRMRVSPWLASDDIRSIDRYRAEQAAWLSEIRPRAADPFAYW
ncbi:hypothetical protein [Burkholderia gladioli]|uniref:hypothetical protein n=1 Tax=Burkholderia gladioli TaxID=28095 RepID=UPI0034DB1791